MLVDDNLIPLLYASNYAGLGCLMQCSLHSRSVLAGSLGSQYVVP